MKKTTPLQFLLILLCFSVSSFAQRVEWGAMQGDDEKGLSLITGSDDKGYYGINISNAALMWSKHGMGGPGGSEGGKVMFVRYDQALQIVGKPLKLESKDATGKKRGFEKLLTFKGKTLLITSLYDDKNNKNYLYAQYINPDGSFEDDAIQFDEETVGKRSDIPQSIFELSQDKTKLLFYKQKWEPKKTTLLFKLTFKLFDGDLKEEWSKTFDVEQGYEFTVYKYIVDPKDNLYVLLKLRKDRKILATPVKPKADPTDVWHQRRLKYNTDFIVKIYNPEKDKLMEYDLEAPGKLAGRVVADMGMAVNDKGQLLLTGIYSNTGTKADGFFSSRMEVETGKILLEKTKDFEPLFFAKEAEEPEPVRKGKTPKPVKPDNFVKDFQFRHVIMSADGSMQVVAEQTENWVQEIIVTTMYSDGKTRTENEYYYNAWFGDIVIVSIDKNGEISWISNVKKNQYLADGTTLGSFLMVEKNNSLHFIFNDKIRRVSSEKMNVNELIAITPVVATVDNKGVVSKSDITMQEMEGVEGKKEHKTSALKAIRDPGKAIIDAQLAKYPMLLNFEQFYFDGNDIILKQNGIDNYRFGKLIL